MLRLSAVSLVICLAACSGQVAGHADAAKEEKDAAQLDASGVAKDGGHDAAADLAPCEDGTGATNCCPSGATSGGRCSTSATACWTACDFSRPIADASQGYRSEMTCIDGRWIAGHGLFPCSPADASAPLPSCTWDAGLYHTDGSSNLCFAARTNTVCTGVNGCTVECLVDDPSQCPGPSTGGSFSSSSGSGSPAMSDSGSVACTDTCKASEYAVECEILPDHTGFGQPPSACRLDTTAPASSEAEFYCCPCGT